MIRLETLLERESAVELDDTLRVVSTRTGVRIDALVEIPTGGIHLRELATSGGSVVARTPEGPVLLTDVRSGR